MVIMPVEHCGVDTRCAVHKLCARSLSWEFDIHNQDEFEAFIRRVASAWTEAEIDHQGLHIHANQVGIGDL